jgi:hypothetical protein
MNDFFEDVNGVKYRAKGLVVIFMKLAVKWMLFADEL